jgi:hypothetical protein
MAGLINAPRDLHFVYSVCFVVTNDSKDLALILGLPYLEFHSPLEFGVCDFSRPRRLSLANKSALKSIPPIPRP